MAPPTAEDVLTALHSLNASHEITILKLSEPISATIAQQKPQDQQKQQQRTSDISTSSLQQEDATTPASLEADLTHYRELFAKLRFSYVEQVTKEKFIRAIVGDPPLIVTPQENVDLERRNLAAKAALKALKTEVADLAAELERRARELSRRYEGVRLETARLGELPAEIAGLEDAVARLREAQQGAGGGHPDRPENPELSLPLAKTLELVEARKRQRAELDRQLEQLQSQVPRKKKELERLQAELQPLEAKRQNSTAAAKEARRRKEQALGGVEDDLEERGRWYRAADATLRQMLEIES
ncbi:hypothetical protein DL769_004019 [Monosporascus sp. CRB-8-3]|nr:hypothetical protein DL769_004019 [Monosporascus sp. CRB-8-3]